MLTRGLAPQAPPGAVDDERPKTTPAGPVAARLAGRKGLPVDVSFDAPFPTTPGLVSRDYQTGDGAYVLVAPAKGALKKVVSDKIFAADGKYGSYGAPADVRLARDHTFRPSILYEFS